MPTGQSDIPILRLEVLQKFIQNFMTPPNLLLMNLFSSMRADSNTIKWESIRGGRGMTPFVPPGSPAHEVAPLGIAKHRASAAYWKEKMPFDEEFLNNLRKPGTDATRETAERQLAKNMAYIKNRSARRKEWMFAEMIFNNGFTYQEKEGYMASVNYAIPSAHRVTLGTSYDWNGGASANIFGDIQDAKAAVADANGAKITHAIFNYTTLKLMANDTTIQGLLEARKFGTGELYGNRGGNIHDIIGVNPNIIGSLLDIPNFVCYDEQYESVGWITTAVSAGDTWIYIDDTVDFRADQKCFVHDRSAGTYETAYILAVDHHNGRLQIDGPLTQTYKAGEDYVRMPARFVPDGKIAFIAKQVDGMDIAEYMEAPYGESRHYGQYVDKNSQWDPEVVWIRVQDKGLPVLYQVDAVYTLDVTTTTAESATSTTTTTTTSSTSTTTTAP